MRGEGGRESRDQMWISMALLALPPPPPPPPPPALVMTWWHTRVMDGTKQKFFSSSPSSSSEWRIKKTPLLHSPLVLSPSSSSSRNWDFLGYVICQGALAGSLICGRRPQNVIIRLPRRKRTEFYWISREALLVCTGTLATSAKKK